MKPYERYFPYLTEVRRRLVFIAVVFIIASVFGFIYYQDIIRALLSIFDLRGVNIVFTSPFQFINLAINAAFLVGTVVVFPLVIWQILLFARPALTKHEFQVVMFLLPLSIALFIFGMGFGVMIMRYIVVLFYEKSLQLQIGNMLDVSQLLAQVLTTGLLMGIAFQFPIVLTLLLKARIIMYRALVDKRIMAYGVSLLFAAILPPTDLLSLVLLTIPLIVLFELTLILNRFILKTHVL